MGSFDCRPSRGPLTLFGDGSFLSVLIEAQSPDLRFQRLSWYPEFRSSSGRPGYPPMTLGKSRFDHFHFTMGKGRRVFVRR